MRRPARRRWAFPIIYKGLARKEDCAHMTARRIPAKPKKEKYVRDAFTYPVGDEQIELPSLSWLKPGLVRKLRHLSDLDQMYTLFEMVLSPEQLELMDELEPDEFEKLCDQWREHSGIKLGES